MTVDEYQSPMSHRYGSYEMRRLWGEVMKRRLWRQVWVDLAEVQAGLGAPYSEDFLEAIRRQSENVNLVTSMEAESVTRHDLVAELRVFAAQCDADREGAGGVLHAGATSSDIEDNADVLRVRRSFDVLLFRLETLVRALSSFASTYADVPTMAFTHLQPAEPTTVGYRAAVWLQDLCSCLLELRVVSKTVMGKGFKGAVGTSASYADLLGSDGAAAAMEEGMSARLGIDFWSVSGQTYPRLQDYRVVSALAGLGAALHKVALDVRLLESPLSGELRLPLAEGQVGSSAMPHKRNPIAMEKVCSLTRTLSVLPQVAWQNAAQSALERTLDDSANRRSMLPEAFLACDEAVSVVIDYFVKVTVDAGRSGDLLREYGTYAMAERVLTACVKAGADRQALHRRLVKACARAIAGEDSLVNLIAGEPSSWCLSREEVQDIVGRGWDSYCGRAGAEARAMAARALSLLDS